MQKLALSIEEFCDAVGIGRTRAYEEIRLGRLKVSKSGRRSLIPAEEIHRWLATLPDKQPCAGA